MINNHSNFIMQTTNQTIDVHVRQQISAHILEKIHEYMLCFTLVVLKKLKFFFHSRNKKSIIYLCESYNWRPLYYYYYFDH